MMKQPKYFLTRSKTPAQPTVSASPAEISKSAPSIPVETVATVERRVHVPRALIFGVGISTLSALLFLVGINTGVVRASMFTGTLPTFLQKPSGNGALILEAKNLPSQGLNVDIKTADARVEIISAFLTRYKSPLTPPEQYAKALVAAADQYKLDYRLLPAIMMQESNLCKASDPKLHNCLGFGIHARGTLGFDTYEEGFDRAARELKANYIDQGLVTPEQIMKKYTPSSNGSWANSVNQWIAEMEHNDREVGKTATADANLLEYTSR